MSKILSYILTIICCISFGGCGLNDSKKDDSNSRDFLEVKKINYSTVASFKHDTALFTEGLVFFDGKLFESTGSPEELTYTESCIGVNDLEKGTFDELIRLEKTKYFGEGISFLSNKLYQLTYKNQKGFIYNSKTFKKEGEFRYANKEGWGMTSDGNNLIMSDGTNRLTFFSPDNFSNPVKTLSVSENGFVRDSINELEYIKGYIYANIWMRDIVIKIDANNGKVVGKIDLSSIANEVRSLKPNADVLNGIAYDSLTERVFITGKLWPKIYVIDFAK